MNTAQSLSHTVHSAAGEKSVRRKMSARYRQRLIGFYAFIAPWLIGFIFLGVFPLVAGLLISTTNYDGLNPFTSKFKGLDNYARIFRDPEAIYAMGRTGLWSLLNVPTWLILCFVLALLLYRDFKGRGLYRTIYYLPSVLPAVTTVWVWRIFLDGNNGLLNYLISFFRSGTAIRWLSDYALPSLVVISVWGGLGGGMLIFLAGLQGIPEELRDAAKIDGANNGEVLRHVVLPLMTPVIFYNLILALIGSIQELTRPLLLGSLAGQSAIPPRTTTLYMLHVWRQIFDKQQYGYGSALVWLMCAVIMILALIVFWSSKYWVYYESPIEGDQKGATA